MRLIEVIEGEETSEETLTTAANFVQAIRKTAVRCGEVPGFVEFHLLRGPATEEHVLYASHTIWRSREDFENWTRSEQFRAAHRDAGQTNTRSLYLGPPQFEGFESVQEIKA